MLQTHKMDYTRSNEDALAFACCGATPCTETVSVRRRHCAGFVQQVPWIGM
jgi:hypothetical protein